MSTSSRSRALDLRRAAAAAVLAVAAVAVAPRALASEDATPQHVRQFFAAQLAGEARLTWFGLHVYDARLFVPPGFDPADPAAHPLALELTYARSLDGKAIAETSRDEIARMGFGSEATRQKWYEAMLRIFPDVSAGLRIAGVNLPGRGVRFLVNGQERGSIDDAEFGRAFFAIWLDPRTRSPKVREGLLRGVLAR